MEDRFSCSAGRAKLVDPNNFGLTSSDNFSVPLEDLNVSVILKSFRKGRTLLTGVDNAGEADNIAQIDVNFIEGSELGGKKVLTSKFTDLTTVFDKDVINDETLGITSIDIEFNASYVPMITINFIDVRGSSIFQNEENILNNKGNKYTTFFQLPYPMFELEIKGFYGLPVKYCLHLTKFNSKFNSQTGNFEITCQFIGYTFALLSDMLLGYLRAIPYTKIGSERFEKYKTDTANPKLLSLDDLSLAISNINKDLAREAKENPASVQIESIEAARGNLKYIKELIMDLGIAMDLNDEKTSYDFIVFKHVKDFDTKQKAAIDDSYISNVKTRITAYNELAGENYKLVEADFVNIKTEANPNGGRLYKKVTIEQLDTNDKETNDELQLKFGAKDANESAGITERLLDNILNKNKDNGISDGEELDVFDMTLLNKKIDELDNTFAERLKEEKRNLAKDFANNVREELGFEPTIRRIVEIFTAAIEVFVESIYLVSKAAEENTERTAELGQKFTVNDLNVGDYHRVFVENQNFYPWPDYREKQNNLDKLNNGNSENQSTENSSIYVEKYLGADDVLKNPEKVDELVFIEDLLRAFRESYRREQEIINDAETEESTWFPINVFDTFLFSDTEPYERTEFLNANDIARLMVIRAMTFFGYSYNPDLLTEEQIAALAQIEVDALIRGVKDIKLKKAIIDSPITVYKEVEGKINGIQRPVVSFINGKATYNYIFKDLDWKILPLNKDFGDTTAETSKYVVDVTKTIKLRDNNDYIFFTNYSSASNNAAGVQFDKKDDGGTYLKIIDKLETPKILYTPPAGVTTDSVISFEKIKQATVDASAGFNCFGGLYGAQEFVKMDWGEPSLTTLPLMYVFYKDCDTGLALNREASGEAQPKSDKKPYSTFSRYFYKTGNGIKNTIEFPLSKENLYKSSTDDVMSDRYIHFGLGKNRDLFNQYINGNTKVTYPYVEMKFGTYDGGIGGSRGGDPQYELRQPYSQYSFSLFGSRLYYAQSEREFYKETFPEYARAYLFLHSLPFNINYSNSNPFDVPEIINLFRNSSGLIHAPRLWCALIGAILWRNDTDAPKIVNKKIISGGSGNADPIKWDPDMDGHSRWLGLIKGIPDRDEYCPYVFEIRNIIDKISYDNITSEDRINRMPEQVSNEFKKIFFDFVNGDGGGVKWRDIADKLEIFETGSYKAFLVYLEKCHSQDVRNPLQTNVFLNFDYGGYGTKVENIKNYYDIITPIREAGALSNDDDDHYLFLELRDDTSAVKTLLKALTDEVILVNSTYKIWGSSEGDNKRTPIEMDEDIFNAYFGKVNEILKTKSDEFSPTKQNEKADLAIFGTTNQDTIKLQLYRTCKNIYDKWLSGAKNEDSLIFQCGGRSLTDSKLSKKYTGLDTSGSTKMIDSFRFVARSFRDIGDELYVNPMPINDMLIENRNTSSYDMIAKILASNNFTFQPLPNFINFNDEKVMTSIFKPFNYGVDSIPKGACGPSFVCVYVGQSSKHLDYGNPANKTEHSSKYPNDGFDLRCYNGNSLAPDAPSDIVTGEGPKEWEEPVSAFVVKYSQQNQNLFKDIQLDQSEFSETDESLKIQDEIAQKGSENNRGLVGQNIYNVYAVRSYTAKVDMMGNAMIQPMMFFQLDNIPMFHGAYLITKVSHSIRPNSMSTNFQGTRIRYPETPLVTAYDVYMSLLANYDTTGAGTGTINTGGGGAIDAKYDVIPDKEVAGKFVNPYEGTATVNSVPGKRTLHGKVGNHKGIDFGMGVGRNIISVYDGTIESVAFQENGAGLYLVINHGVIGDKTYKTVYMHLSDLSKNIMGRTRENFTSDDVNKILKHYNPNLKVKKGDVIGKSGGGGGPYLQGKKYNTSGRSTGPHLHWELRIGGKNDSGTNVFSLQAVSGLRFIPAGKDYDFGDSGKTVEKAGCPSLPTNGSKVISSKEIYTELKKVTGLNNEAIAGIMGNLFRESGFKPQAYNSTGGGCGAYGMIQWRGGRLKSLASLAQTEKTSIDDYKLQIKWMYQELSGDWKYTLAALKNVTNPTDGAKIFAATYEAGNLGTLNFNVSNVLAKSGDAKRINFAKNFYKMITTNNFT